LTWIKPRWMVCSYTGREFKIPAMPRTTPLSAHPPARTDQATLSLQAAHPAPLPRSLADLDHLREAMLAKVTLGLSPESLALAWMDWTVHLASAPGKRLELVLKASQAAAAWLGTALQAGDNGEAAGPHAATDPRFAAAPWQQPPFQQWANAFLLCESWWEQATRGVPGVQRHHEDVVAFMGRQVLDMLSPSNLPWANPEVLQRSRQEGGLNLLRGLSHALQDTWRNANQLPPAGAENFKVGQDVAVTPGKVVMRNHLAELIQYSPTTPSVYAEPVLLVPAWIMKYYILDLSPHNSLVRWLVDQGHTVFCLSWHNATADDRDLSLDDYRRLGVMAALDAVNTIVPGRKVHATGYCLGGTLLSVAAAAMAAVGDERLASVSLFAAQTDFSEPGELQLFIDPSQVNMLDSMMWARGYLTAGQMAGAFQMMQSKDLVWSRVVHDYLLGDKAPMNDLTAWNADATRMPYRMHSEYLHQFFLNNELATGHHVVDGKPVALQNIRVPMFALGTERDHVAPWHSVYKLHYLADTEVTFALTSGGHNAGVVSAPGNGNRHYRLRSTAAGGRCLSDAEWLAQTPLREGSWWLAWQAWLARHSSTKRVAPPPLGGKGRANLGDAPGSYVLQR
jgi:polyhydroxyalkanoate synthase